MADAPGLLQRAGRALAYIWSGAPGRLKFDVDAFHKWLRSQLTGDRFRPGDLQDLMGLPPSYASVRVICDAMAGSPVRLMQRVGEDELRPAREHHLWPLVTSPGPNKQLPMYRFVSWLQYELCIHHDAFARLWRDEAGRVEAMVPLPNSCIREVMANLRLAEVVRRVRWPDGVTEELISDDLLHVMGFGVTPYVGLRILDVMAASVGRYRSTDDLLRTVMADGANIAGFISVGDDWSEAEIQKARDDIKETWSGADNAGGIPILSGDEDVKFHKVSQTAEELQLKDLRLANLQDQARMQVLTPTQIGDYSHGTYSNVEQAGRSFVNQTLGFWAMALSECLGRSLLEPHEHQEYLFTVDTSRLTMGSLLERYQALHLATGGPWMTPNEVRALDDHAPMEDLDTVLRPLNMGDGSPAEA